MPNIIGIAIVKCKWTGTRQFNCDKV